MAEDESICEGLSLPSIFAFANPASAGPKRILFTTEKRAKMFRL